MMSAFSAFERAMSRVEAFASTCNLRDAAIRHVIEDPSYNEDHVFKAYARAVEENVYARWQDYALAITLAYGAFEVFVVDLASDYLAWVFGAIDRFADLPDRIKSNYVRHAVDHLDRSLSPHYRGTSSTADIAKSVHACGAAEAETRVIIAECLLYKEANFRGKMIDEFLARVGIENASACAVKQACFEQYVKLTVPTPTPVDLQAALQRLDQLVDRRNDVAHGIVGESLSLEIVVDDVKFLRALGAALVQVVEDCIARSLLGKCSRPLGVVHAVYNHNIVTLNMDGVIVRVGDLIAVTTGSEVRSGRIRRIEIDGSSVKLTEVTTRNAGLQLTTRVKDTNRFALIPSISRNQVEGATMAASCQGI